MGLSILRRYFWVRFAVLSVMFLLKDHLYFRCKNSLFFLYCKGKREFSFLKQSVKVCFLIEDIDIGYFYF